MAWLDAQVFAGPERSPDSGAGSANTVQNRRPGYARNLTFRRLPEHLKKFPIMENVGL